MFANNFEVKKKISTWYSLLVFVKNKSWQKNPRVPGAMKSYCTLL